MVLGQGEAAAEPLSLPSFFSCLIQLCSLLHIPLENIPLVSAWTRVSVSNSTFRESNLKYERKVKKYKGNRYGRWKARICSTGIRVPEREKGKTRGELLVKETKGICLS